MGGAEENPFVAPLTLQQEAIGCQEMSETNSCTNTLQQIWLLQYTDEVSQESRVFLMILHCEHYCILLQYGLFLPNVDFKKNWTCKLILILSWASVATGRLLKLVTSVKVVSVLHAFIGLWRLFMCYVNGGQGGTAEWHGRNIIAGLRAWNKLLL